MISKVSIEQKHNAIEAQMDFYKSELLEMGYFKTPEGLQLYELSLPQLEAIYKEQKAVFHRKTPCK